MCLAGAAAESAQNILSEIQAAPEQTDAEEPETAPLQTEAPADPAPEQESSGNPGTSPAEQEKPADAGGMLQIGSPYLTTLGAAQKLRMNVPSKMDLQLQAGGVPVKVRIINVKNGWQRSLRTPDTGDAARTETAALITLSRGEYLVVLEPVRMGPVSICFSRARRPGETSETKSDSPAERETKGEDAPQTGGTDADTVRDTAAEPSGAPDTADISAAEETPDGTGEDTADPEEASEAGKDQTAEGDSLPDDAEKKEEPSAPDEEAAPQPLTVTVTASCEGPYEPGALITLRASVSDDDYQGTVLWQYSADGGLTVCEVEGAEGPEYSFVLDEINSTWWWRAYLR